MDSETGSGEAKKYEINTVFFQELILQDIGGGGGVPPTSEKSTSAWKSNDPSKICPGKQWTLWPFCWREITLHPVLFCGLLRTLPLGPSLK